MHSSCGAGQAVGCLWYTMDVADQVGFEWQLHANNWGHSGGHTSAPSRALQSVGSCETVVAGLLADEGGGRRVGLFTSGCAAYEYGNCDS